MLAVRGWFPQKSAPSADPAANLAGITAEIGRITLDTEPQFAGLTGQLQEIDTASRDFATKTEVPMERLNEVFGGTEFNGDNGIAVRAIDELNESLSSTATVGTGLVAKIDSLLALRAKGHELLPLDSRLSYCRTAFAIDCDRNAEHEAAFRSFLEERKHLSGEIGKFGERIQDEAGVARANLRRQSDLTRTSLARLREYASLARVAARASCDETGQLLARSGETMRDIAESSLRLRELADVAGYFMQFGDLLRQKLEPVPAALSMVEVPASKPRDAIMLALQAAHLGDVSVEIDAGVEKLEAALSEMVSESELLYGHLRELQESGGESGGQGSQKDEGGEHSDGARTLSGEATACAAQLAGHLDVSRALTGRIYLLALNAIIKSEAFGESSASLSVLSNQVHELYIETNQLVEETVVVRESLCAEPVDEAGVVAVAGGSHLMLALERITGIERCLTEAIADLAALHAAHPEQLAAARPQLAFLSGLAETVRTYWRQLDELAGRLPQRASDADVNFADLMELGRPLSPHRRPNRRL